MQNVDQDMPFYVYYVCHCGENVLGNVAVNLNKNDSLTSTVG